MENVKKHKVGVVGSGSWATAIVKILCENLEKVNWWVRSEYVKGYIQYEKHNPKYLTGIKFHTEKLNITADINELMRNSEYVILAAPSIYLQDALSHLTEDITDKIIFSSIKGIIPEVKDVASVYLRQEFNVKEKNIGIITGPCHAEEIALERLSYLTVATVDEEKAKNMSAWLNSRYIKTTLSDDVFGTEYAAVVKNIFAVSCGIAHGLRYGDNFQAVLLSNSIREMESFLDVVHPIRRNINNSAYLGDLLVTGCSFFSRNRMLGNMIGKGYTVHSAMLEMNMVAEGYYAAKSIWEIARSKNIKMPIAKAVYEILYEEKNPEKVFRILCNELN
ncbi:MAG: NAD(P)H-dependent glycerol-3-phosphate dehydrogenase [Flavobacteriaceae bacterium]|jgi:glycerol-3-phosphate dehydrogenase (NAD(P)+)|nr:NAD(P)H-dependent glycerol-3-phosphate dehydrogenase [Flavobacteriaceae bacterium]